MLKLTSNKKKQKKRRVTYIDSFKGCNVILHYYIHFV